METIPQPVGKWHRISRSLSAELLSQEFSPPPPIPQSTVIHHPNQQCRAVISFNDIHPARARLSPRPPGRTPSPGTSSSSSPLSRMKSGSVLSKTSTGQTSVYTTKSQKSAERRQPSERNDELPPIQEASIRFPMGFPWQETTVKFTPSVTTVESVTAFKIYMETYFSNLFSHAVSPRSIRLRRLRRNFHRLDDTEQQQLLQQWQRAESEHLRQVRVLKSTSSKRCTERDVKGSHVAGYECLRALGKGSFGIVRLVTPSQTNTFDQISPESTIPRNADILLRGSTTAAKSPLKNLYAMKVIRKSEMLRTGQEGHLRAERDLFVASEASTWVVPLIASFQDNNNLYLVMEYMVGGDFLVYLLRENMLDEATTRHYIAEMILCVEELHRMDAIHRDIKPDNFLISSSGHLKISDFGLAFDGHWAHATSYYNNHRYSLMEQYGITVQGDSEDVNDEFQKKQSALRNQRPCTRNNMLPRPGKWIQDSKHAACSKEGLLSYRDKNDRKRLARSIVGTSQYMAPEVISGQYYDGRCDWWSIGIILYECLYGTTPFFSPNKQQTKENVLNHRARLNFPRTERWTSRDSESREWLPPVSGCAIDLIRGLLTDKDVRLSSVAYLRNSCRTRRFGQSQEIAGKHVYPNDSDQIKAHPFFESTPWDHLHLIQPPWVPKVNSSQSVTRYFEDEEEILGSESASFSSLREKIDPTAPEECIRSIMGRHFERWKAEQRHMEIFRLGLEAEPDDEIDRYKEYHGDGYQWWRNHRIRKVRERRVQDGMDPDDAMQAFVKNKREGRRAKDRMLRDPKWGNKVLELRKTGAFLGYTYRRPKIVFSDDDARRNQPVYIRPTIIPVNG